MLRRMCEAGLGRFQPLPHSRPYGKSYRRVFQPLTLQISANPRHPVSAVFCKFQSLTAIPATRRQKIKVAQGDLDPVQGVAVSVE
jgi:hypothetical protein